MVKILLDQEFRSYSEKILLNQEYQSMRKYVAHGTYTVYDHCFRVALFAYSYAKGKGLNVDYASLVRGALLHDYYLYDWHHAHEGHRLHGFRHPYFALHNAKKKYRLNKKEMNIILSHMFPLTFWILPLCKEAWLITYADKVCANRERKKKEVKRKHASYAALPSLKGQDA